MLTKSWINCALIVIVAYVALLHIVNGISLRHKRKNAEQANNSVRNDNIAFQQKKIENQPSVYVAAGHDVPSKISFPKNKEFTPHSNEEDNAVIQNDVVKVKNAVENNISKPETVLENNRIVQSDIDSNDNNGAGDGVEELEPVQNKLKNKGDKGHLKEEVLKEKNVRKNLTQILRYRSEEEERKEDVMKEADVVNLKNMVHQPESKPALRPLKMNELQPPDHVDGLRMEHDGHLNRDYKKEILLGNHEEFEWENEPKLFNRLKDIFHRADIDQDGYLDLSELKGWIMLNVQQHLNEAIADNRRIFSHLDTNNDDFVTWKEFYVHFLLAKGHDLENAQQHSEDYDTISLDPDEKEKVIRYKFRWAEADEEPQDNRLTLTELMNFRHPEQSKTMLGRMVKDLIENFDRNDDKLITEEEFAMIHLGEVDSANIGSDQEWLLERKREFREVIDLNKDGIVDEAELKVYVDPHNANHAKLEAENLIHLADQDADGRLTINEVLENAELFLGSKMVDASRNFHDEF